LHWPQLAQIISALNQNIERAKLHLVIMLPAVQGVEIGNAINTHYDGFATYLFPVWQNGLRPFLVD
jgi:hypothetical protein